jgi:hypothetical protein
MSTFSSSQQLRELFTAFMESVSKTELRGFSGSGIVIAYNVSDPPARFVLDAREPSRPGKSFAYYVDDPNAPAPTVEIHLSSQTLDRMYSGELNVTVAAAQGKIRSTGDRMAALRMLPVMFRTMNHYKATRAVFFAKVAH